MLRTATGWNPLLPQRKEINPKLQSRIDSIRDCKRGSRYFPFGPSAGVDDDDKPVVTPATESQSDVAETSTGEEARWAEEFGKPGSPLPRPRDDAAIKARMAAIRRLRGEPTESPAPAPALVIIKNDVQPHEWVQALQGAAAVACTVAKAVLPNLNSSNKGGLDDDDKEEEEKNDDDDDDDDDDGVVDFKQQLSVVGGGASPPCPPHLVLSGSWQENVAFMLSLVAEAAWAVEGPSLIREATRVVDVVVEMKEQDRQKKKAEEIAEQRARAQLRCAVGLCGHLVRHVLPRMAAKEIKEFAGQQKRTLETRQRIHQEQVRAQQAARARAAAELQAVAHQIRQRRARMETCATMETLRAVKVRNKDVKTALEARKTALKEKDAAMARDRALLGVEEQYKKSLEMLGLKHRGECEAIHRLNEIGWAAIDPNDQGAARRFGALAETRYRECDEAQARERVSLKESMMECRKEALQNN